MSQRRKTRFGPEGLKHLGVAGLPLPASLGTWENHRSRFGAHTGVAPRGSWLSAVCACEGCLASPSPGTSVSLGDPGLPKPVLLSDPRRWQAEVGCVLSLGQVNGWDMTMVTHDQARKRLTKRSEEVVRLLVTRQSLQKAVQQSMLS